MADKERRRQTKAGSRDLFSSRRLAATAKKARGTETSKSSSMPMDEISRVVDSAMGLMGGCVCGDSREIAKRLNAHARPPTFTPPAAPARAMWDNQNRIGASKSMCKIGCALLMAIFRWSRASSWRWAMARVGLDEGFDGDRVTTRAEKRVGWLGGEGRAGGNLASKKWG